MIINSQILRLLCFAEESLYIYKKGYLVVATTGQKDGISIFDLDTDRFIENGNGSLTFTKSGAQKVLWHRLGLSLQEEFDNLLLISNKNEMLKVPEHPLSIIGAGIKYCGYLNNLSANPFKDSGFNVINNKDVFYNTVKRSQYFYNLKPKPAEGLAKLSLRAMITNDSEHYGGFAFIEIILAWQMFSSNKIMAIPCLYGTERGLGKTTILSLADMLYEDDTVLVVNTADSQAMQWGDLQNGKRIVIYDDVPNAHSTVSSLSKKLKSDATQFGNKIINIKGGGIITSNAINQSITTNFVHSIPLDEYDDRRIYPVPINSHCYTKKELQELANNVPNISKDLKNNKYIEEMLGHFLYVYESTKYMDSLIHLLNKRVPLSKFKKYVIKQQSPILIRFMNILENCKSKEDLLEQFQNDIIEGDSEEDILQLQSEAMILEYRIGHRNYILFKSESMPLLWSLLKGDIRSAVPYSKIAKEIFPNYQWTQYKIDNKNIRGIRMLLKT